MRALFLAILLFCVSCAPVHHLTPLEKAIKSAQAATVKLIIPGRVCTAFHIGKDTFLTAAHCLDGQTLVFLSALDGGAYLAKPVVIDEKLDLATLRTTKHFTGGTLELWSSTELVACGYPGYYNTDFTFEVGWLKDFATVKQVRMIVSSDLGYPGESGGPVIETQSGRVIGVNDLMSERIAKLGEPEINDETGITFQNHQHNTVSFSVGLPELKLVLDRTEAVLAHPGGT
jgi:hypothetical protein